MSDRHRHRENLITAYNLAREDLLDGVADMEGTAGYERLKAAAAKLDAALGALLDSELSAQDDLARLDADELV
jgi:hypothetical protein